MKNLFALIALLTTIPAMADDVGFNHGDAILFHIASKHSGIQELNELNPGLSYRHGIDSPKLFATAGFFRNSNNRTSSYAGVGKTFFTVGPAAFTLVGGVATGYIERVTPALIPEFSFHYKNASFIVGYIPGVRYNGNATIPAFTFSVAARF